MEVALKLAYEFARRTGPQPEAKVPFTPRRYHGDTVGAVSLGHIELFHQAWAGLLFKSDTVMAPYCYRCPFTAPGRSGPTPASIANASGNASARWNSDSPRRRSAATRMPR